MDLVKAEALQGPQGLPEVLFGLPRKSHDEVAGEPHIGKIAPEHRHPGGVVLHRVAPIHQGQDPIAPRLEGQVEGGAEGRALRQGAPQLLREVFGVVRGEAKPPEPPHTPRLPEQPGKGPPVDPVGAVAVHVLPHQGHVLDPRGHQASHLVQDGPWIPGGEPSPHVGNDAVGTEIVAAVGDGDKGPVRVFSP